MDLSSLADELRDEPAESATGRVLAACDGRVLAINSVGQRLLRLIPDQVPDYVASRPLFAVIDPHGYPVGLADNPARRVLASGRAARGYVVGLWCAKAEHGGRHIWLDIDCEPVREPSQRMTGVLATFTAVAGPRAVQLDQAEPERVTRLLLERSSSMVALHLADSTFTWLSPAAKKLLGYSPEQLVGTRGTELIAPEDLPMVEQVMQRARKGASHAATFRVRHADGRWVWVETVGQVMFDHAGGQLRIQSITRDVSERIAAEHARDEALNLLRMTMDHAPIGMAVVGPDGRWVRVNHAMCQLTGYAEDQLMRRTFRDITHPEDLAEAETAFATLLGGKAYPPEADKRYIRADGQVVWVHRRAEVVRGIDGRVDCVIIQVEDITARKQAETELARMAVSDPLTGLPNRLVLLDRLTHALELADRVGTAVGVLFLDLDGFKTINDSLGHDAGDELLRQVAQRLSHVVREGDTVVRLGGDEFVVVCEQVTDLAHARTLGHRVAAAFDEPFQLTGRPVETSASIGIAIGHQPPADELLRMADTSMYQAKRRDPGYVDSYRTGSQVYAAERLVLAGELRDALRSGELYLDFQPIVGLADRRTASREALLRWAHPARGLLLPETFMAAAEGGQFVAEVGRWVLHQACAQAAGWRDDVPLSVNISARHLSHRDFAELVQEELAATGLPPNRLCLEITETVVLNASPSTLRSTSALAAMGVTLALDDFGTGQSSITALHRLPIGALKIDQSFVTDLAQGEVARKLVDGLIRLGTGLDITVIAEGVETPEQAQWLLEHGCTLGQGYLLGRPGPIVS